MEVCKLFNRLVYFVVERSLGNAKDLDPYVLLKAVATWGGRLCLAVFLASLAAVTYVLFKGILPTEWRECENVPWFVCRALICFYVYYNIVFHYYKARTLKPVKNPGTPRDKFCVSCNDWKGPATSHCKACDRCIYRMDHHCPHIAQCVGAHNQANFFLFLVWLLIGTGLYFVFAPSFWYEWFQSRKAIMNIPEDRCWRLYCVNKFYYLLVSGYGRYDSAIKFSAFLFAMLHWIMWGFVCAYSYIISSGLTMAMRMFQKSDEESRKPFTWRTMRTRWRKYFNCQRESLWTVIFVPRARPVVVYEQYKQMLL